MFICSLRDKKSKQEKHFLQRVCVCVCVCVSERGRHDHTTAACLQTHTCFITVSVTWLCSPLGLELMVKLRTLLTVFTFILKAKARDYGKGCYISDSCLWFSSNHNALGQLANQSVLHLTEGGTLKSKHWREAGHRGPTIMYSTWKIMCFLNNKACQHILLHQIMIFKKSSYDLFKFCCKKPANDLSYPFGFYL